MLSLEEKYLKYKTKYLVLKNNIFLQDKNNNSLQIGGYNSKINFFDLTQLTDTPINNNNQTDKLDKSDKNNILDLINLSDTPTINNNQNGGKKYNNAIITEESELNGGKKSEEEIAKYFPNDSSDFSSSSDSLSISDSSESLLSALEDSNSDNI